MTTSVSLKPHHIESMHCQIERQLPIPVGPSCVQSIQLGKWCYFSLLTAWAVVHLTSTECSSESLRVIEIDNLLDWNSGLFFSLWFTFDPPWKNFLVARCLWLALLDLLVHICWRSSSTESIPPLQPSTEGIDCKVLVCLHNLMSYSRALVKPSTR